MHVDPERNSEYHSKLTSDPYFHQRLIWRILPYSLTSRPSYFLTLTQPDSQPNARRLALSCRPRTGGLGHCIRWTAAALRMSRSVRGELGFKASRSIRRLLWKHREVFVIEPSRRM